MSAADLADIRGVLWAILAELKDGTLDAENAEQQIAVLDSLLDVERLEANDTAPTSVGEEGSEQQVKGGEAVG